MSMLRKALYALITASLFGAFMAGCGGGSAGTNPPPPPPPTAHEVLFASNSAGIQAFSINSSTGMLTALASTPDADLGQFITGNMLSAASGKFLLAIDATADHIKVFSINQTTGGLTPVTGSPFAIGGGGSGSLAMDSSGKYLYAPFALGVAAFSFNSSTGFLSPLANSPFSDGSFPFAGAVDPSGKFLYTTGNTVDTGFSVYALNPGTGALAPVVGSPFATPLSTGPYNLVVAPAGLTVYATVPSNNAVIGMTIDPVSGTPTPVAGSPFSAVDGDMFLGLAPSGKFLYTCNNSNGTISAFSVNSADGSLTPIAGTPFGFSNCSATVAVNPGKYLYAANPGGNAITGFSIDATTGVLTMLSGSPFPAAGATLITIATLH
ncbi:MAG: beta-propeller fold lactonase family protein [Acidobacteria bacterium]|nr:beta-propeller fold lactonase family protein [Acidobacteriota bacterium]